MLEHGRPFSQRSMKTGRSGVTRYGARSSEQWIYVCAIFGILCLLQCPVVVHGTFTCPTNANCTCESYRLSGGTTKYQNITCTGQGLIEIPSDGKEGADVTKLVLNNNQITSINHSNFQYFTNLVELDLANNQISSIASDAFSNLTSLHILDFSNNQISSIDEDLFSQTTSLRILNLGANKDLSELPEDLFRNVPLLTLNLSRNADFDLERLKKFDDHISYLDISHMSLTEFPKDALNDLDGLNYLDISYNNITELTSNSIKRDSITTINLSHNSLTSIHKNAFNDDDAMTNLDLSYNQLTSLDKDTFKDLTDLEILNLSNNLLVAPLETELFKHLDNIQTIDLSYNEFSFLSSNLFSYISTYSLDVSNNPLTCDCDFRNFLYTVLYNSTLVLLNPDITVCSHQGVDHMYLDWDETTCTGNLGNACSSVFDCMVQNAACVSNICMCRTNYYDTNTVSLANGLCKPLVSLNYGCDIDDACETQNSECGGSSTTTCVCKFGYYDTYPLLGGSCELQVELGGACTSNELLECKTENAHCGTNLKCVCESAFYDSNTESVDGGECIPKLSLHSTCNGTDQCGPDNSECSSNSCSCMTGFYEIDNSGLCQGPQSFYSCYPYNTSSVNINFEYAAQKATTALCEEFCFTSNARHYLLVSDVCICGNIVDNGTCCPKVMDNCNSRQYIGPTVNYVKSGLSVTTNSPLYVSEFTSFGVTTTLGVINQIKWGFGDSQTESTVNGSSSNYQYTYTRSGQFDLTIKACHQSSSVCDIATLPVRVQVPRQNLTTYITAHASPTAIANGIPDYHATFKNGYDFEYYWQIKDSNNVEKRRKGCSPDWIAFRDKCILQETTPASFTTASGYCTTVGATLLQINYLEEMSEIVNTLAASSKQLLTDARRTGGILVWNSNGTKTIFSEQHLTSQTNGDCVVIDGPTQTLTTVNCDTNSQYACMKDPVDCPHGGELLDNKHCVLLASTLASSHLSWSNAQHYCETNLDGWLANITSAATHTRISNYLSSNSVSEALIGLSDQFLDEFKLWADNTTYNSAEYAPTEESGTGNCFVTKLNNTWARTDCDVPKDFLCEYSLNIERLTIPAYLVGTPDVKVINGQNFQQQTPFDYFDDNLANTEVVLFPGMVISKSGNLRYWIVHTVDIASGDSYDLGIYIIRPSCSTGTLVQAGCEGTKFATCSSSSPTCIQNTCSTDQHFCYLSNTCKFFNESCTCNSESGITSSCASSGTPPVYSVYAITQVSITTPGENILYIPASDLKVQEHDIIAIQYKSGMNPLKNEDLSTDDDRQSTYKVSQTGWLSKNDIIPTSSKTDEDRTYYFHGIYTETQDMSLPTNLAYAEEVGEYELSVTIIDTDVRELDVTMEETIEYYDIIYPLIQESPSTPTSQGTVYLEHNVEYDVTIRVEMGTNVQFTFDSSTPVGLQSTCASEVLNAITSSDVCNASLVWSTLPFASVRYNASILGTYIKNFTLSNPLGTVINYLTIKTEKRIQGMTFALQTSALIPNNVASNRESQFEVNYTDGTDVSISYQLNGVGVSGNTSILTYNFTTTGTLTVSAFLTNILGVESINLTVYAKQPADFSHCIFIGTPYIAVINVPCEIELQCTVNQNAEVTSEFYFDDDSVTHTQATEPTTSTSQTWTFSKTFNSTGEVQVTASLRDSFASVSVSSSIDVFNQVPSVILTITDNDVQLGHSITVVPTLPTAPGNYGTVNYTIDFGDSVTEMGSSSSFAHTYASAGSFTVNVTASNGPSSAFTTQEVKVYTLVDGLSASNDGPNKKGTATVIIASNSQGNFASFQFVSAEFNETQPSGTFAYIFSSAGIHEVNITCFNTLSSKSTSVTVYVLKATEIITESLRMDGVAISGCIESGVNKLYNIAVIHYDLTNLEYNWNFGDGTIDSTAGTNKYQTYSSAGNYTINVTISYSPENAAKSITANICIEDSIQNPSLSVANQVGLPSAGVLNLTIAVTLTKGTSLSYTWASNATVTGSLDSPILNLQVTQPGFYNITVSLSNSVSSNLLSKLVQVIEEISDVTINCASCTTESGNLYITTSTSALFSVGTATGTDLSYSWHLGDGTTGSGASLSHSYTSIGSYTMIVSVYNDVHRLNHTLTVYVESALTSIDISNYQYDWIQNILSSYKMDLDISKTARFRATVQPTGMNGVVFLWEFDTGLQIVTTTSDIGEYNYTTTGEKLCKVTAVNKINNITSSTYDFYAIETITNLTVNEGTNVLSTSSPYLIAQNIAYNISVSSSQNVDGTSNYAIFIRNPSNALIGSNTQPNAFAMVTPTEIGVHQLSVTLENSLGQMRETYKMEVIELVSGPFINGESGEDGNITLGSPLNLFGGSTSGKYQTYDWAYLTAPAGQTFTSTDQNVTLLPTSVGQFILHLNVTNAVSPVFVVEFRINVMEMVSGVSIDGILSPHDAIEIGSMFTFRATAITGTGLSYSWVAVGDVNPLIGDTENFTITFGQQAYYNITLAVSNFASTESVVKSIYSLNNLSVVNIQVSGATYNSVISKYPVIRGAALSFLSDLANTDFVEFQWQMNSITSGSSQIFDNIFLIAGTYVVNITVSNKISSTSDEVILLVEDTITDFQLTGCNATYLIDTDITLGSSYTQGTDVSVQWEGSKSSVGASTIVNFASTGEHKINVTASNYVDSAFIHCIITAQGTIANLVGTVSDYKFVGHAIIFSVAGDYISYEASFSWAFSNGETNVTTTSSLDKIFSVKGTYSVTVNVSNAVSWSVVSMNFTVEDLKCSEPDLRIDGSSERTTLRARSIELSVTPLNNDCTYYTSVNKWTVYEASSCQATLTTIYSLPSTISTNTPVIRLQSGILPYNTYCFVFEISYSDTPVAKYAYFNVTISASPLVALITGGDSKVINAGTTLALDGSKSNDPDNNVGLVLSYAWSCSQTMGTATAITVCDTITALTNASSILTGITLTKDDVYDVTLTVSASGSISGQATTKITVIDATGPVVSIECISCEANKNYQASPSKKMCLKGTCSSGCDTSTTYQWTVTDMSTNNVLSIASQQTTTGTSSLNLCLNAGTLEYNKSYKFHLQATSGSLIGFAEQTFSASTVPHSGSCTLNSTGIRIIPMTTTIRITCQNWIDPDTNSGLYYKTVASYGSDSYIVSDGSQPITEVYLSPWPGTNYADVQLTVYVVNDLGIEVTALTENVQSQAPTLLLSQTDNVNYLVDQMFTKMKTEAKKNNPKLLLQYIIPAMLFLNDQSENQINTTIVRSTIRDYFSYSLDRIPTSEATVSDIQQISSAVKYLSAYPDELRQDTLSRVDRAINTLSSILDSNVQQGHDQQVFQTDSLQESIVNTQTRLQSFTTTSSDTGTVAKLGSYADYALAIGSSSTTQSYPTVIDMQKELAQNSIEYQRQCALVMLKTLLADEAVINTTLSDGSVLIAEHLSVDKITQSRSQNGITVRIPENIFDYISYTRTSAYQITVFNSKNPLDFDTSDVQVGKTIQTGFHDLNGTSISVTSLPSSKEVELYMFTNGSSTYTIPASGLKDAAEYNPRDGITNQTCIDMTVGKAMYMAVNGPTDPYAGIHIQILPEFSSSQMSGELTARLYKNSVAYTDTATIDSVRPLGVTYAMYSDPQSDHENYTVFIPASERVSNNSFKVELSTNQNVRVCVSMYFSKCAFYDTPTSTWASTGCVAQSQSLPTVANCKCDHMTSYGSGLLLSPDQIDFTDLTDLDVVSNPVAIITCSIILGLYIILVVICRRMDLLDIKHISSIPLCGKDGSFKYEVMVFTGRQIGAGTTAHVGIQLLGKYWKTAHKHISKEGAFQRNCCDTFIIAHDVNIGEVKKIRIWHDNNGSSPSWYLNHVVINDLQTDQQYYFYYQSWLTLETTGGSIHKKIAAAGSQDRNRFGHRFSMAIFNSLADKHLWLSLLNRPAQSRFTRVQRATCCVTLLFTFICVNAMWYGLLKKDNQDLGWDSFSWEEIVLAIVTNVMVFPINLGIIFLFKKSRSKASLFSKMQKPDTAQTIEIENYCENSQGGSFESRNTGGIPYDLDRESTIDSVLPNTRRLHHSKHVHKHQREDTDDSLDMEKRPSIAVTNSSGSPSWDNESLKWPDNYNDDFESRPSTSSTLAAVPKKSTGGFGTYKKSKTMGKADTDELLAEIDKLMEPDSRPPRSASDADASRRLTMTMTELEGLDDILHSDDETSGGNKTAKKSVLKSKGGRFNPRADPRINGNGNVQLMSRGSMMSSVSTAEHFSHDSGITSGIRPAYYSELTMESRDVRHIPIHKEKCSLPPWCVYIAYVLCFLLCTFSVIIVILYCFRFGADEAIKWVLACLLSLFLSFCIMEPLKALMIAIYAVAMFKNVDKNDEDDCIEIDPTIDMSHENIQEQVFEPISGFALIRATEEGRKIRRMKTIIRQFFAYLFYLWVIMVIVYVHFHFNSFLFNKYVETSFVNSTTSNYVSYNNISTIEEFWDWTENVFVETLHLQDSHADEEHGFLLGAARMRLIRSLSDKCHASSAAASLGASVLTDRICHGDGGFDEDTGFYAEHWNESSYNKSWKYVWANELGGSDKLGLVATYSGGGYLQTLGTSVAETLSIVQDLKDKGWIDLRTRAVVLEFSFYSPGSDMTAVASMLIEFPLTGGVITSYEILSQKLLWYQNNRIDPLMVMECILLMVVVYSCVHIVLQVREKRLAYFKEFWHWYEIVTTCATIVSIGMYIGCVVEATNTFNNFLNDQTGFTNFEHVAYVHVGMRYLYAWLLFLLMYKVVKQLRFIKFMYVYGETLSSAFGHIIGAFFIYFILLLAYAQLGHLMYGRNVSGFESVGNAVATLIVVIRGTFNFWPMLDHQPVFSHFYVFSYYAFAYGILVALVISVLQSFYKINKERLKYDYTVDMKDYEMIEFMMKRFKLWAGIKKPKPAFRRVRFPDLPSVASRPSTSHSNHSTESTDSASTAAVFDPESYEPYLKRMANRLGPTWQLLLRRLDELDVLDQEEQRIVTEAEAAAKDINLRCRINELERQGKDILSWKKTGSSKPPAGDSRHRQSQRLANHDNQGRKAPSTVTGATSIRAAATPPSKEPKPSTSRRPFSDQGARVEHSQDRRASAPDGNSKLQKFFKAVKPSKSAWSKDT